jgi:AcrR family transcriptional regulator
MSESDQKTRIVQFAREKFLKMGFSKVTMDELVQELGISKKTMYKYFASKDELVGSVLEMQIYLMSTKIQNILDSPVDFMEKLNVLWIFVGDFLSGISKQFLDDLRRFRPELWHRVEEIRTKKIVGYLTKLFEEGQMLGLLRADVNINVVVLMFRNAVQGIVNPDVLVQQSFSAGDAMRAIILVLFEGILTDEAKRHNRFNTNEKKI